MKFTFIFKNDDNSWNIQTFTEVGAHIWANRMPTKSEALLAYMSQGGLLSDVQNLAQYCSELERLVYGVSL